MKSVSQQEQPAIRAAESVAPHMHSNRLNLIYSFDHFYDLTARFVMSMEEKNVIIVALRNKVY
jgi:hypothetical protein